MTDRPRLIQQALALEQASLGSVHEKEVPHRYMPRLQIRSAVPCCPGAPAQMDRIASPPENTSIEGPCEAFLAFSVKCTFNCFLPSRDAPVTGYVWAMRNVS